MKIKIYCQALFIIFCFSASHAQKFRYSIPGLDTLQESFIVSGAASSVLRQGQTEFIFNNSLISYWIAFHENGKNSPILDRLRNTLFLSELSGYYGISSSGRIDAGIQVGYARTRLDNSSSSSPFRVFRKTTNENINEEAFTQVRFDDSFGGLAYVGARLRFKPITYEPGFILTAGYSVSTIKDESQQVQLNADRDFFDLGASYYKSVTNNVYYFFSTSLRGYLSSDVTPESLYNSSFNFFLIHRTNNQKLTFYPGISYNLAFKPSTYDSHPFIKSTEFLFAYGGLQYSINRKANIFLTMGIPLFINIINPLQDIVRESYSVTVLGARIGI
ncbi:MAG: hypothetical protein KDC53_17010 [Saprospiraceae bacterium]|nr:hypothetical protein [Saprospiraceae bacterium]